MKVRPADELAIRMVVANMRAINRAEMLATRWDEDLGAIAAEIVAANVAAIAHLVLCGDDGTPVALVGAWLVAPGVAVVRLVATDQWLTIAPAAYRWLKREFIPRVLMPSVRRAETRVMYREGADWRWFQRLGFRVEGVARALGKNGEDFLHVAWINPNPVTACATS